MSSNTPAKNKDINPSVSRPSTSAQNKNINPSASRLKNPVQNKDVTPPESRPAQRPRSGNVTPALRQDTNTPAQSRNATPALRLVQSRSVAPRNQINTPQSGIGYGSRINTTLSRIQEDNYGPNIRVPRSYNIQRKETVSLTGNQSRTEDNGTSKEKGLEQQVFELQTQNERLKAQNRDTLGRVEAMTREIKSLRDENQTLRSINEAFGDENDQLNVELDKYRKFRLPRSAEDDLATRPTKRRKGKSSCTDEEEESDIDGARSEMKAILKNLPPELNLKYDEKFTSETNVEIRRRLVPELFRSLRPRFNPTHEQLNTWLQSLHKHRRSRYNYSQNGRLDQDNRRLHSNNRLNEKKVRRIKGARSLFDKNDERLAKYDRNELMNLLKDSRVHSPELSDTDDENPGAKRKINIYDLTWRSVEIKDLLRNILDPHSLTLQSSKLTRARHYKDDFYYFKLARPNNVPEWAYVEQESYYEMDQEGTDETTQYEYAPSSADDDNDEEDY